MRAIIDLGHNLELNVTAEGVWTSEIKDMLETLGCDAIQGFYLSTPIAAEDMPGWLEKNQANTSYNDEKQYADGNKKLSVV